MSYVICSNDYDEENDLYSEINAPYSFQNILSNGGGLRIPKNAEIAVQSVKINKTQSFTVSPDFRFYVYFGEDIDDTATKDKVTNYPIEIRPFTSRQSPTSDIFADAVEAEINLKLAHPLAFKEQVTTVHRNASGQFAGYNLDFKQTDEDPVDGKAAYNELDIFPFQQTGLLGFSYNDTLFELTSEVGFGSNQEENHLRQCIFSNYALCGKHIHDAGHAGVNDLPFKVENLANCSEWAVGLIRGSGTNEKFPSYFDLKNQFQIDETASKGVYMTANFYCDYVVGAFRSSPNGQRFLRIFEASVKREYTTQAEALQDNSPIVLNEIRYYGAHSTTFTGNIYNWSTNADGYDSLEFYLNGERISVTLDDTVDLINEVNQPLSTRENLFKPINQACWCLYPKFYIESDEQTIVITSSPHISEDDDIEFTNDNMWWADTVKKGLEMQNGREIDTRFFNIIDSPLSYTPKLLSDDGSYTNLFADYLFNLVVKRTDTYFAPLASGGQLLGFRNRAVVPYSTDNSTEAQDGGIMTSTHNPLASGKSLFVRLSNFTHQSFNAGNGNRSKIIFHLPRFDNSGREDGEGLYFEASERFYVKLNNTEEFVQNAFDIEIVDDKEVVAREELKGKTIVCLHIQSSKD